MAVETYRKRVEISTEVDPDRAELLGKLGLEAQKLFRTDLSANTLFKPLEGFKRLVFEAAFPVVHSRYSGHFKNYQFDRIPTEALEAIDDAVTLGVFSDIQIWTPGAQGGDPVAVGVAGQPALLPHPGRWHYESWSTFLIARWGVDKLYTLRELAEYIFCGVSLEGMPQPRKPDRGVFERCHGGIYRWVHNWIIHSYCRKCGRWYTHNPF